MRLLDNTNIVQRLRNSSHNNIQIFFNGSWYTLYPSPITTSYPNMVRVLIGLTGVDTCISNGTGVFRELENV